MKFSLKKLHNTLKYKISDKYLVLLWCNNKACLNNWGDALNEFLVHQISKKELIHSRDIFKLKNVAVYTAIGSVLDNHSTPNTHVWGSGFLNSKSKINVPPQVIHAVRGPLTRKKFLDSGLACPEIYGDPALLYPSFYNPSILPDWELGLICHYSEKNLPIVEELQKLKGVKTIDIELGLEDFVKELKSCRTIASSSLHGLIAADAYKRPSAWLKLSDAIHGDEMKYYDYFLSQGCKEPSRLIASGSTTVTKIQQHLHDPFDKVDLDLLLESCPFKYEK